METRKEKKMTEQSMSNAQKRERLRKEIEALEEKKTNVKLQLNECRSELKYLQDDPERTLEIEMDMDRLKMKRHRLSDELDVKRQEEEELIREMERKRCFDKYAVLRNIRELLKTSDIKLGQIEKNAGYNAGYMSRLEKAENSTDPTLEFVISAARDLNVSVDYLIHAEVSSMSSTQQYTYQFLDRLKMDTIRGKLPWKVENYSRKENSDTKVTHPLFSLNRDYKDASLLSKYIFVSRSFGAETITDQDCYSVSIGRGATLYVMNISKAELDFNDKNGVRYRFATEVWMHLPNGTVEFICADSDEAPIGEAVGFLDAAIRNYISKPRINESVMNVIEGYMNPYEPMSFIDVLKTEKNG